jgi:hypothetical protein
MRRTSDGRNCAGNVHASEAGMEMPRSFGVFAPVGWVVIAFPGAPEATRAREALVGGGYDEDEVVMFAADEVIRDIEAHKDDVSFLAYFGPEPAFQAMHLEHAKQGSAFLVVFAPTDAEGERVSRVARRFGARLAHKYNRRSVQELI